MDFRTIKTFFFLSILVYLLFIFNGCSNKIVIPYPEEKTQLWSNPRVNNLNWGFIEGCLRDTLELEWTGNIAAVDPTSPTVFDGVVTIGTKDKRILGFDRLSGKKLFDFWSDIPQIYPPVFEPPLMAYFGMGSSNFLRFVDIRTGKKIYSERAGDSNTYPILYGDTATVFTLKGGIYTLIPYNHEFLWIVKLKKPIYAQPAMRNDTFWVAAEREIFCINRKNILWRKPLSFSPKGYIVLFDGCLVLYSNEGDIKVISSEDGAEIWSCKLNSQPLALVYTQKSLIIGERSGKINAFQPTTGELFWESDLSDVIVADIIGIGGKIVTITFEGDVFLISVENGEKKLIMQLDERVRSACASDGERIFISTLTGKLICLR